MENFTPISAIMSGLLIGTAAMLTLWRLLFIAGLLLGGAVFAIASGGLEVITPGIAFNDCNSWTYGWF